ncbi:pseudouridine synthase [Priestia koreensis]|uniref:Pseudouridine synthase n=1 Tax=Priestia koreensis TaxID=284581 RepID=A0A0M0KG20_9BACI|nr:pseudouridine synthase [Priestia koreensis]KOO37363.1 pseudouridine synthase [Priestia koreensis]
MRINKYVSLTGFCSRRQTDRLIEEGRITINGRICEPGDEVEASDLVLIDHQPIPIKADPIYLLLNKPVGVTCTAAPHVQGNIMDFMNFPERIFPVGRLDKASQGLIIMTNDGDIVNRIMRSEHDHEKEYVVTLERPYDDEFLRKMGEGVAILGTITKPCKVTRVDEHTFTIVLTQGLNRQIRRMSKELGHKVMRLERIRIMNLHLDGLKDGEWREFSAEERKELFRLLGQE